MRSISFRIRHYPGRIWRGILSVLLAIRFIVRDGHSLKYSFRLAYERTIFSTKTNVHDLPEIFHYWSNTHLAPKKFHQFGINSPDHFFFLYTKKLCNKYPDKQLLFCSIGAGNCDLEVRLALQLLDAGYEKFKFECLDINDHMLARGMEFAVIQGVQKHIQTAKCDFNKWQPDNKYDSIIANQCLHHVLELERLFGSIHRALSDHGYFLTSDIIGRNGHQRWPEAMAALQPFWAELPDSYRFNRLSNRMETECINHDYSTRSFEGIRAQDILALLDEQFHFELFIPYSTIITTFIDRPFGHNFDATGEWDKDFVDRVHACDEAGIMSGELKPTQMLAVLRNVPVETQLLHPLLTPDFCLRDTG